MSTKELPPIALFANTSWYLYRFRKNLIRLLVSLGHETFALASDKTHADDLQKLGAVNMTVDMDPYSISPLKAGSESRRITKQLSSTFPNGLTLLPFTPKANIYAGLARRKIHNLRTVHNISGLGFSLSPDRSWVSHLAMRLLWRRALGASDGILFQNDRDRGLFQKWCVGPAALTAVVPGSGVDLEQYTLSRSARSPSGICRFVTAARLLRSKGVLLAAEAIKGLREKGLDCTLLICGIPQIDHPDGLTRLEIDRLDQDDGIRLILDCNDIRRHLAAADAFVLPTTYAEGVPRSLLEAGATGLPLIVSDNPGTSSTVINNETGYILNDLGVDSLSDSLGSFARKSESEKASMGRRSHAHITTFYDERFVLDAYAQMIEVISQFRR